MLQYIVNSVLIKDKFIETHLYSKETLNALDWIDDNTTLLQRYLIERLYRTYKNQEEVDLNPDSPEYSILESLSIQPHVKDIVQKYLFYKK